MRLNNIKIFNSYLLETRLSITIIHLLNTFDEKIAIYFDNCNKQINIFGGQNSELL